MDADVNVSVNGDADVNVNVNEDANVDVDVDVIVVCTEYGASFTRTVEVSRPQTDGTRARPRLSPG